MNTGIGYWASFCSMASTVISNVASAAASAMPKSSVNGNDLEPVSFLMAIAMHPLYGEEGVKYKLEDHQFKPMKPSNYPLLAEKTMKLSRTIQDLFWKTCNRNNFALIEKPLNKFCEWYLPEDSDGADGAPSLSEEAKQFLGYVQVGLMSFRKLYLRPEPSVTQTSFEKWIEEIYKHRMENPAPTQAQGFELKVKNMLDANKLNAINSQFADAFRKQGILIPAIGDGPFRKELLEIERDPNIRKCDCQREVNIIENIMQKRIEEFQKLRDDAIEWTRTAQDK